MKPAAAGALIGALLGFATVLALHVFVVSSALLNDVFFPGRIFLLYSNGMGMFGHMVFDTFAYFSNLLLYAAVGYGIGWLFGGGKRNNAGRDV